MSYATSVSGAKSAQAEIATISNNLANAQTSGFKRSRVDFGDLFTAGPAQNARTIAGGGVRIQQMTQNFSQGTFVETGRELDLGIAGDGFFIVKEAPPSADVAYTRAGAFQLDASRFVVDSRGARVQLLALDATGNVVPNTLVDFQVPAFSPTNATAALVNVGVRADGLAECSFADGTTVPMGKVALASFTSPEGLRQVGDAHWRATLTSGAPRMGEASSGSFGEIRSSALENANVDVTEEMVALMVAQRNFQANAKALEIQSSVSQAIINVR